MRLYLKKNLTQKWSGGVTQVVESPPNKHEALSSLPQYYQKQQQQKQTNKQKPFVLQMTLPRKQKHNTQNGVVHHIYDKTLVSRIHFYKVSYNSIIKRHTA
jgi:hypothetical protein